MLLLTDCQYVIQVSQLICKTQTLSDLDQDSGVEEKKPMSSIDLETGNDLNKRKCKIFQWLMKGTQYGKFNCTARKENTSAGLKEPEFDDRITHLNKKKIPKNFQIVVCL